MNPNTPPLLLLLQKLQDALREEPEQRLADFWSSLSEQPPFRAQLITPDLLQQQLYANIARPWERLKRNKQKKSVLKKMAATDWGSFQILNLQTEVLRKPLNPGFVLELLRNAISHDKVKWDHQLNATFSDWEHNRLRFSLPELIQFMEAFRAFREGG